ncbi:MAG: M1 family metallopeptidase, partial [Cyanobacteria bacterium REEB65]|nr:M1 family metallopeptidase [Cyanobacteria bacterium REEB65]
AMENWGGITFNESALLFDPLTSSQSTKEGIYNIVAHEVAHQWFGNLVTMAWWDDLWLNEGFANWMASKATDRFNPSWRVWPRANRSKNMAMLADARRTTHPIHQAVSLPSEAVSRFDEISYEKGEAVIRMLEAYLSEDVFGDGIRRYMKAHAYGNSTTDDLWAALEEASGKEVGAIARSWIRQPGFPLVSARLDGDAVRVSQSRFTLNFPEAEPLRWRIPLAYQVGPELRFHLLEGDEVRLPVQSQSAVKVNSGDCGYFRVWHHGELADRLRLGFAELPEADRVSLLADEWALAQSGQAPLQDYFGFVEAAHADESLAVWQQILDAFDQLDGLLLGEPARIPFQQAACRMLKPLGERLGWDERHDESDVQRVLRARVLGTLGRYGDSTVLAEARVRFEAFLHDPVSLPGNLRPTIFGLVGRVATPELYDTLHRLGREAERIEDRSILYAALGRALDPALASRTLAISLTDELDPTLATRLVLQVGAAENRDMTVGFALEHLDALLSKCDTLMKHRFLGHLYEAYADEAKAKELEEIARRVLPEDAWPEVEKSADQVRFQAEAKRRLLHDVESWAIAAAQAG